MSPKIRMFNAIRAMVANAIVVPAGFRVEYVSAKINARIDARRMSDKDLRLALTRCATSFTAAKRDHSKACISGNVAEILKYHKRMLAHQARFRGYTQVWHERFCPTKPVVEVALVA